MDLTGDDGSGETGCMFLPTCAEDEDDGPTDKLDLEPYSSPSSPPSNTPPPTGMPPTWSYDSGTQTYYRFATEFEQDEHDWPEGTVVLSAPTVVDALINGTNQALDIGIPLASFDASGAPIVQLKTLSIQRRRTQSDVTYVTSRSSVAGPIVETFRPEVHLFLPSWVELSRLGDGAPRGTTMFAAVFGDSHGGVAIEGMTADQDFSILGPSSTIWLESASPGADGVLVSKPRFHTTEFDNVLAHWIELAGAACSGETCTWEPDGEVPLANCGDQVDNDADCDVDGSDWACKDRPDYGCGNFGPHNHLWENSKDFAVLPDIEWCTQMDAEGMPWYSEIYSKASLSAQLINAIALAANADPSRSVPAGLPEINYRFAYCVFAETVDDAIDCVDDAQACPVDYKLGGITHEIDDDDTSQRNHYFRMVWDELDVAMHKAEADGATPKPVAMVSAIYSGDITDSSNVLNASAPVGLAASIGHLGWESIPDLLGASTVETNSFLYVRVAHEAGHSLGLSHTDPDEGFYDGKRGFMYYGTSGLPYAVLGPSRNALEGYQFISQWAAWSFSFPDKEIPRPNAFDHSGCSQNSQCPENYCWNGGALGICRPGEFNL